jgi:type IV pilus assembly protein PilW
MRHSSPLPSQRGFSLAELLVAVAIGLVILASLSTLFVKNMRTPDEIEKASRQVENGRFAIDQISADLRNAGYYAEFDPSVLPAPATLPAPCATDTASLKAGLVLPVQGVDGAAPGCLPDARPGTDVVVVRRTSTCVAGAAGCDPVASGGPFFQASLCNNPGELDSANPADYYALDTDPAALQRHKRDCTQVAGSGTLADVRRYLTHIYYIANNDKAGDGIPTLMRAELADSGSGPAFTVVPLAEGIENLQLEYGMDLAPASTGDGVADQFSANPSVYGGCALDACAIANWRSVVSVKLHLLARNTVASTGYQDKKSYVLGKDAGGNDIVVAATNDAYRRHVFQSLVALPNPAGRRLP